MSELNVSSFMRMLSYVYVYAWIPIRLNYLRLKIALRPIKKTALEILAMTQMIWAIVPIAIILTLGETLKCIATDWLRFSCLLYEKAAGIEPGTLYEKGLSLVPEELNDDADTTNETDKNTVTDINEGFHDANDDAIEFN